MCRAGLRPAPTGDRLYGVRLSRKRQTRRTRWFEVSAIHIEPSASKITAEGRRSEAGARRAAVAGEDRLAVADDGGDDAASCRCGG